MEKKRLDLKLHPDNVFSKPLYGDISPSTGMLIKVRRRRYFQKPVITEGRVTETGETSTEPEISIEGLIKSVVRFDGIFFIFFFLV